MIAAVPGHVGARYNLGRVLIQLGRQEEGVARLEEFRSLSRLRDQIDFYRQAVKKNPRNAEGRVALAQLLLEAGRTEEALRESAGGAAAGARQRRDLPPAGRRLPPPGPGRRRGAGRGVRRPAGGRPVTGGGRGLGLLPLVGMLALLA